MRKITTASFSFALAGFTSYYCIPENWLLNIFIITVTLSAITLIFHFYFFRERQCLKNQSILSYKQHSLIWLRILISLFTLSVAFGWNYAYTEIFISPSIYLHDKVIQTSAIITDFPVERSRGYRVDAKVKNENGHNTGVRLYYYKDIL